MNTWKIVYNKFNSEEECLREAICTLGNGYFGTRGAVCENYAGRGHYPGTYIAGVYNTLITNISGRDIYNEDFVNCPNWLKLNFRINRDKWLTRFNTKILLWKVELDLKKGVLSRRVRWQDDKGRITLIESQRIVSMAHPHLGGERYSITPENYNGEITVRSGIDGLIINGGVGRYGQLNSTHLDALSIGTFSDDGIFIQMQTNQSKIEITEALRTLVYKKQKRIYPKFIIRKNAKNKINHEFTLQVKKGEKHTISKLVSVYTSRDHGVADNLLIAQETVNKVRSFDHIYNAHVAKWTALWKKFDVEVKGDDFVQLILRLHTFHLLQSASTYNEDIDAGMTARGLHGEAYRGHIFWDELYIYPFYNLHAPEITRALLMYRYRRLGAAKEYAKQNSYKGAMYPWQSASIGDEQTQVVHLNPLSGKWGDDYSCLQRHVSIAIAYNVWTYYFTTGDRDFLNRFGAEMILEIANFWSSVASFNNKTKRFEIDGVMGPDEYHEKLPDSKKGGLKNNAYTNVMATWVIDKALRIVDSMLSDVDKNAIMLKTGISNKEISLWRKIADKMTVPMDENGIIHQFDGYMDLEDLDWDDYRERYDNIHRMDRILKSEGLSPDDYKLAKQADVLMLFYVLDFKELKHIFNSLGYKMNRNIMKKNFNYYFPRTSHGSTLSLVVHGVVADLLGYHDKSMGYLIEALQSDIYDTQGGTTKEGIHAGVMGSSIDLFLRSFAGLSVSEDKLTLDPNLPESWGKIKFKIRYKNIWFNIEIKKNKLTIIAKPLEELPFHSFSKIQIEVKKSMHYVSPKKKYIISF